MLSLKLDKASNIWFWKCEKTDETEADDTLGKKF